MAACPGMEGPADGNTSTGPHGGGVPGGVGVFEAMRGKWYNSVPDGALFAIPPANFPNRKVRHGQALRDLRQGAAIRTPRQPRQEPGQPEVRAQPADGPRDRRGPLRAGSGVHPLPAHLRRLSDSAYLALAAAVFVAAALIHPGLYFPLLRPYLHTRTAQLLLA